MKDPANDESYDEETLWDWCVSLIATVGALTAFLVAFIYSL